MKKKGFTLIELLAVIVILGVLAAIVIPSVFTMVKNAKKNSYNILIDSFEESARLYATRHQDLIEAALDDQTKNYAITITLADLKNDNLLKADIVDPRDNVEINYAEKEITITRFTDKTLSICYEDRICYIHTLLTDEISDNLVSGTTEGVQELNSDEYIYRGSNPNNWIEFNDALWRIVKVNNDNTIQLIYEGTKKTTNTAQNGKTLTLAQTLPSFSTDWAGNMLEIWYQQQFTDTNIISKIKTDNVWCVGSVNANTSKANFKTTECNATTVAQPVGLISSSDYLYASLDTECINDTNTQCKNKNYLSKTYNYWNMTTSSSNTAWHATSNGTLSAISKTTQSYLRASIILKAGLYVDRGDGSFDKPYILKDIVLSDKLAPVITVLGSNPINIKKGDSYTDAGATALDAPDGDLTSSIISVSTVNTSTVGTYYVTYVVSDASGNKSSVKRTVNVLANAEVNEPLLADNMIPVAWNGSNWIKASSTNVNNGWYDYMNKNWANAVLVTAGARAHNQSASVGTVIEEEDILAYYVWIPRYAYQISSGYHTKTAGTINVKFLKTTTRTAYDNTTVDLPTQATYSGSQQTNYILHPAFTFGADELTGIWVAKFESGTDGSITTIKPNQESIVQGSFLTYYYTAKAMQDNASYGWNPVGIDTHMAKNTEWGAVAYLAKTGYGKGAVEVWNNNVVDVHNSLIVYETGCAGNDVSSALSSTCLNSYYTEKGVQASTTGNITGVYDMSGGANEYTAAYINSTHNDILCVGVGSTTADVQLQNVKSLASSYGKYFNIYNVGDETGLIIAEIFRDGSSYNINAVTNSKGDAIWETSNSYDDNNSWHGDSSIMPTCKNPFFTRGGNPNILTTPSWEGIYNFDIDDGLGSGLERTTTFRSILLVKTGL